MAQREHNMEVADLLPPNAQVLPTGNKLGIGVLGEVHEVQYEGKIYAAKKFIHEEDLRKKFTREHAILARIRHENIVPYFGACELGTSGVTVLVMERMQINLSNFLQENAHVPLSRKVTLLRDVAQGLVYLHSQSPAIIHRDLTAENVLLNAKGIAKIADFGNSRLVDFNNSPQLMTSNHAALEYMPPEAIEGGEYNDKLDSFSFGHLSIYVIIHRRPHPLKRPTYTKMGTLLARSESERREDFIGEMEKKLSDNNRPLFHVITSCLQDKASDRPSSYEILDTLSHADMTKSSQETRTVEHCEHMVVVNHRSLALLHDDTQMPPNTMEVERMISMLKGQSITTVQAQNLAKKFHLSAKELGVPPETELSVLCRQWIKKDCSATPRRLVKALMTCEGLGKYVSGLKQPDNPPAMQNFVRGLGKRVQHFATYLGYPKNAFSPEATPSGNSYASCTARFLKQFRMPDCGDITEQILHQVARNAGIWLPKNGVSPHQVGPTYRQVIGTKEEPTRMPSGLRTSKQPSNSPVSDSSAQQLAQQKTEKPKKKVSVPAAIPQVCQRLPISNGSLLQHCMAGKAEDCDAVQQLLDKGSTVDIQAEVDGSHPLHLAVVSKSVEMFHIVLLQYEGRSVDVVRDDHKTPLMVACVEKQHDFVKALIEQKADVNAKDIDGLACLHYKETLECVDTVELLLKNNANVDITSDENHLTPLAYVCFAGLVDTARVLLRHLAKVEGDKKGLITPLCYAAGAGHLPLVKLLIQRGAKVNNPDKSGRTPLLWACLGQEMNVVSYLIHVDADVDNADKDGEFPVMVAIRKKNHKLLQLLIKHNADVNKTMREGDSSTCIERTPLAAACTVGDLQIVQTLIKNKAKHDPLALSCAVAADHSNIVEYMLQLEEVPKTIESLGDALRNLPMSGNSRMAKVLLDALGGAEKATSMASGTDLQRVVKDACQLADKREQPRGVMRTLDPQTDGHLILGKTAEAILKTAERKRGRLYLKSTATSMEHYHITTLLDDYYEGKMTEEDMVIFWGHDVIFPLPLAFICSRDDLFDGVTFKAVLEEMGALDIVKKLPSVLRKSSEMLDLDESNPWHSMCDIIQGANDKLYFNTVLSPRFLEEVEPLGLLNPNSELSAPPIRQHEKLHLNMDDLNDVSAYLQDLTRDQLRILGLVLGLTYSTLKNYDNGTKDTYMHELLAAWLRQQDKVMITLPPTWNNLVKALTDDQLRQHGIATRISQEKC